MEMSVFIKYEYREIFRVCFSGQYGKRDKLTRRQTIDCDEYTTRQSKAHENALVFWTWDHR